MEVRRSWGNSLRCVGVRVGPWKLVEVRRGSRRFVVSEELRVQMRRLALRNDEAACARKVRRQ